MTLMVRPKRSTYKFYKEFKSYKFWHDKEGGQDSSRDVMRKKEIKNISVI